MLAPWTRIWRGKWAERESRGGEGGGYCKTHSSILQAIRWETKCRGGHVKKNLKSSLTVLESNSCLFWARTFSTPAWSVYVTNPNPLRRITRGKERSKFENEQNQPKNNSPGEARAFQSQDGAANTPPSYLDRLVTGSRITMHSFTSPNLQKYSFKPSAKTGGEMWLDDPRTSDVTFPPPSRPRWGDVLAVTGRRQWGSGGPRCVCAPPTPNPPEEALWAIWPFSTTAH